MLDHISRNMLALSGDLEKEREYWLGKLQGSWTMGTFPYHLPAVKGDAVVQTRTYGFPDETAQRLLSVSKGSSHWLFIILAAGVMSLLNRYTGQQDLVIGMPALKREGEAVNSTLPLRTVVCPEDSFRECLNTVKAGITEANENEGFPVDKAFEQLHGTSRQAGFVYSVLVAAESLHGLESIDKTGHDMVFVLSEGARLDLHVSYNAKLYDGSAVDRLAGHLFACCVHCLQNPDMQLGDVPLMDDGEVREFIYGCNQTEADYPRDQSIIDLFHEQVRKTPDHPALVCDGVEVTFEEADRKANQVASYLAGEHGICEGHLVGILLDNSIDQVIAILGILKSGAAYVPIDPNLPVERMKLMMMDTRMPVMISHKKYIRELNGLLWECPHLKACLYMDSYDIYAEQESRHNTLMNQELWEYIGNSAEDDIAGGGWVSSYTGQLFTEEEMNEYSRNVLMKLQPHIHSSVKVLEMGCASGLTMFALAPYVGLYYGTDLSRVIIEKDQRKVAAEQIPNVKLECLAAHEIDRLEEKEFDIVVMNSVIQSFHGHNYLRQVLARTISKLSDKGIIFLGDIMDQDLKGELLQSLADYKREHPECVTKTDFSEELFLSREFLKDLKADFPEIGEISFSAKYHTIENELTRFRFDAILHIDKTCMHSENPVSKRKPLHDRNVLEGYPVDFSYAGISPGGLAYIIYTSGTTGIPKGTMVTHQGLVNYIWWANKMYLHGLRTDFPLYSSISFDLTVTSVFVPLTTGNTIVIYHGEDRLSLIERIIQDNRVDIIKLTPTHLKYIRTLKIGDSRIKTMIVGGENLNTSLAADIYRLFGSDLRIYNEYGPTETVVGCMIYLYAPDLLRENVLIGVPADNVQLYILNGKLQPVPFGVAGELYISGDGVAKGYLNRDELTKERFICNPFIPGKKMYKTGDYARRFPDGQIEYLGRLDYQEKIRGFRIELGEIESQLSRLAQVKEAVVTVKDDPDHEKYLCAYLVAESELSPKQIREELSKSLPYYMVPHYFVLLDRLPVTANGKVDRKLLPEPAEKINNVNYTPPVTLTEKRLVQLWESILHVTNIGRNDHFFEMGGHSLKATSLMSHIYMEFHAEIPLREIFRHPVLHDMARWVDEADSRKYMSIPVAPARKHYPLSSAQKRMVMVHQLDPLGTHYNMPGMFWIEGDVNPDRIGQVFRTMIARHESLRTSIQWLDGKPVQVIEDTVEFNLSMEHSSAEELKEWIQSFLRPFDLEAAPLLRVSLVKVDRERNLFLFDMHHIISDGVSMNILVEEFVRLYNDEQLPELRIQYKDYAVWQQELFRGSEMKKQEMFWMDVFQGEVPVLELPTDRPRPPVQSFAGASIRFRIGQGLAEPLKRLAGSTQSTLYMVLLSAYTLLLSKYTDQEDIVIGTPVAGRLHADLEPVIGMFVNTLVLRNFPVGEMTFLEYLQDVRDRTIHAFEHQDYPIEELVEKLELRRDISRNPLFDTMFALQNTEAGRVDSGALQFKPYEDQQTFAKFDLTLNVMEDGAGLDCNFEYSTALFDEKTIQRMSGYLISLLEQVVSEPRTYLADVRIITEDEQKRLIGDFNDTGKKYPRDKTIHRLFEEQVERTPDHVAVVYEDRSLTYRELNMRANGWAAILRESGVKPNGIVGIVADRSVEMIVGIMAVLKSGGAYLPIDPRYPEERIQYTLEDAGAAMVLTQSHLVSRLAFCSSATLLILDQESPEQAITTDLEPVGSAGDLAYVIYTSGSTGQPKGVMIEHRSLVNLCVWHKRFFNITECDRSAKYASAAFDASVWELFPYLISGAGVCLIPEEIRLDIHGLNEFYHRNGITVTWLPPQMYEQLAELDNRCLRVLLTGADKVKSYKPVPYEVWNTYGPTESTVICTAYRLSEERTPVPIGKPLDNNRIYILSKQAHLQPIGIPGEICIAGAGLARGYLNRPDLTESAFTDHPFEPGERIYRTGDLGRWLPDGNIEYLGRIDQQVKIRGYRIELGEIEACLSKHERVKQVVAAARQDEQGELYLCAYVTAEGSIKSAELRQFAADALPYYMIPSFMIQLDAIPLTPNGKVDFKKLPKPDRTQYRSADYVSPQTETEKLLVSVWEELLGIRPIGLKDNFFQIGGDSIKAIQVASKLHRFGHKLTVHDIFQHQTIEQIIPCLETVSRSIDQGVVEGEAELLPVQRMFLETQTTDPHHFNQSILLWSPQGFGEGHIRQVFTKIVEHHDALRMIYPYNGTRYLQYNRGLSEDLFCLDVVDLTCCSEEEELARRIEKEADAIQASMDLRVGPLVKLGLFKTGSGDHLLIAIHHLVVDGVSWRILLEDLASGYKQAVQGREIQFALKTDSFQHWGWRLKEYADSPAINQEIEYWSRMAEKEMIPLPKDKHSEGCLLQDVHYAGISLSEEHTRQLLREVNHAYHTEINDILLTALTFAICDWSGRDRVLVNVEGHGREEILPDVDITRTVGWFTACYPVLLEAYADKDIRYHIKSVKENLKKIPNNGIGYGLLKYATNPANKQELQLVGRPELSFNYLGQFDGEIDESVFRISPLSAGRSISSRSQAEHLLDMSGMVADGMFTLRIGYSSNHYEQETVEQLGSLYKQHLERIIEHCSEKQDCEITPSDLTSPDISIEDLEELNLEIALSIDLD